MRGIKNSINRYTLNLVESKEYIPIAMSTLENIDRLSTNFESKDRLMSFLKSYVMANDIGKDLVITYHADKHTKEAQSLFSNMRGIVDDKALISRTTNYLSKYSNLVGLQLNNLNNKFLRQCLFTVLEQKTVFDYNFRLSKLEQHLINEYKLTRDLSLFLDDQIKKRGQHPLIQSIERNQDIVEIRDCLNQMKIFYQPVKDDDYKQLSFDDYLKTGDDYLYSLITHNDYETISLLYDLDDLEKRDIKNVFDGNHGISKTKKR